MYCSGFISSSFVLIWRKHGTNVEQGAAGYRGINEPVLLYGQSDVRSDESVILNINVVLVKQDIFLIVKPSHFHVKILNFINVHTFSLKVSAVMCLQCCFSGSRKVQAVVGVSGQRFF